MNKTKPILVILIVLMLIGCNGFKNPVGNNSDNNNSQDDSILINESGTSEHG